MDTYIIHTTTRSVSDLEHLLANQDDATITVVYGRDCFYGWGEARTANCLQHITIKVDAEHDRERELVSVITKRLVKGDLQCVVTDPRDWEIVVNDGTFASMYRAEHVH